MRRTLWGMQLLAVLMAPLPLLAGTPATGSVLITELQTRSAASAGAADEEFLELYNTAEDPVDLSDWRLEYQSAGGTSWLVKATLHGVLPPGKSYLLASTGYLADMADTTFAPGLSDSGGHLRLVSTVPGTTEPKVHDLLGWGNAAHPDGSAAAALSAGKSLQRKINEHDLYVDTDDNSQDFALNDLPTPQSGYEEPEASEPEPTLRQETSTPNAPAEEATPEADEPSISRLEITELLPNPAAPQTDDQDEYVELYNPNDEPVDLAGYKLQTGMNFSYSYKFVDEVIGAKGYLLITSGGSNLTLANSAGRARLLAADGTVMAEATAYEDAEDGQAWALIGGTWQWTTAPTPGAANILAMPVAALKTKAAAKPKATTKASAKKAKTAPKTSKKSSSEEPKGVLAAGSGDVAPPMHPLVLAGVSGLALLYAGYEYRHDVSNRIYQLRSYRAARRAARASA